MTTHDPGFATDEARMSIGLAPDERVEDVLVFAFANDVFRVTGGRGHGAGWADIVEVRASEELIIERVWRSGVPVRISESSAVRIVGPYWAKHAAIVAVGHEHIVVFGASSPIRASDAMLVNEAAQIVAMTQDVPAEKLLADELEVVHAVRALMAYRPETVTATARHIAQVAARALSCDVAALQVWNGQREALEVIRLIDGDRLVCDPNVAGPDASAYLREATTVGGPLVEQEARSIPRVWSQDVVSRLRLPIGTNDRIGALALGHAVERPRGFTMLCQRIGRALAEAAELLLSEAMTRERIAVEHELLRRASATDPLTGVGNRAAWDQALAALTPADPGEAVAFAVLSVDLDGLKRINDRFGHAVGDSVIRGAAILLQSSVREGDVLARVGGDEFMVLLPETGEAGARLVVRRIQRNIRAWRVSEHGLSPELSVGWAVSAGSPPTTAARADERMYAAKRKRTRSADHGGASSSPVPSPPPAGRLGRRIGERPASRASRFVAATD
jgi:diguanylate cyclase (GGDEF)-like protein